MAEGSGGGEVGGAIAEVSAPEPELGGDQPQEPKARPTKAFDKPTRLGIDQGEEFLFDAIAKSNEGHRAQAEAQAKGETDSRERDSKTGRFLPKAELAAKGETVDNATEVSTPEPKQDPRPAPAEPKPTSAKLRLGDREFESPDQAAELIKNTEWHFGRATESANAWKAEAERLRAQLGQTQPAQTPVPQKAESPLGIDEETAQAVWEEAQRAERPDLFMRWVAEEQAKQYEAKLQALEAKFQAPLQQQQAQQQLEQTVAQAWNGLDQYTLPDGSKAFPEIHDPAASAEIAQHWRALGLPPEAMVSQSAMVAAIGTYRMFKAAQQPKAAPVGTYPSPPSDAHNVIGGAQPPTAAERGDETLPAEVRRLVNGLNQARNVQAKGSNGQAFDLGFSR